jgi:CRISPR-associated endonuclease/helicase Cas3
LVDSADEIAAALFDEGLWDELIERTHVRWGVWGCAYLEALLRAADGQVSAEGS